MRLKAMGMLMICAVAAAQKGSNGIERFAMHESKLTIHRNTEAEKSFTVAGARGLIVGLQNGTFEAWVLPIRLLSNLRITAEVQGYPVPIDANEQAAAIDVFPDHTVITYSHVAFTVRQIMFAPDESEEGTGAVVLFEVKSVRPVDLTFRFTPEMQAMWPQPGSPYVSPEWVRRGSSGFYVIHTDFPNLAGAIAMPGAQPGVLAPYQEKPQFHPLELRVHSDPKKDAMVYFPLLLAIATTKEAATTAALEEKVKRLSDSMASVYAVHAKWYERMESEFTSIHTPDREFNDDFAWAMISIEQLRTRVLPTGETALVAGYYGSGNSARPGFGWFFGRDALYTLDAVDSFGDFDLALEELKFLIHRQREDGKIMHEYSQTAAFVDWKSLPYMYAAADSTPLFLMTMLDYAQSSGDAQFIRENWEAIKKAWQFEITHDSDGDGIYDNSQGTGWVESWPGGMPHQEIYLALLDWQASIAMSKLARINADKSTEQAAESRAQVIKKTIESEYYDATAGTYGFSRGADGSIDKTRTMFPVIAWWNNSEGLDHPEKSFAQWASNSFSTDWGTRDVARDDPVYDPISYHQGSVWPLFTGWTALAEYRAGRDLSGYAHLRQNADQTTTQDLGAVTELLSGDFFVPFGRSTSHQLWSSAMVVIPTLRGLFGIDVDAQTSTINVSPHLPADWDEATVEKLHVGSTTCSLKYERRDGAMNIRAVGATGAVRLSSVVKGTKKATDGSSIAVPLPAVEIAVPHGLPASGMQTRQVKVLEEIRGERSLRVELEGFAGSEIELFVRRNLPKLQVVSDGGTMVGADRLRVQFPGGDTYQRHTLNLHW
jgi:glycogen debranching enzyme